MPLQAITVAGLGPGAPDGVTLGALEALRSSKCTYLRTGKHPVVNWLIKEGISFSTFDYLYEMSSCFEEVYARIGEEVIAAARSEPVLYAVPGHPLVAEESVRLIIEAAEREGARVGFLPAVSFLDAIFAALRLDPGTGIQVVDGLRLAGDAPLPARAAVVTQVYSRLVAADVKISLLEFYPPEHPVTVVRGAGVPGEERIQTVPLFELDRLGWVDHLTSLFLPGVGSWKPDAGCRGKDGAAGETQGQAVEAGGVEIFQVVEKEHSSLEAGRREKDVQDETEGDSYCRYPLDQLVNLLARLRGEGGCPWDREQDHLTLRPYLLEEAYEVLEALNEENMYKLSEELGDLLLQVVFHAQIASEKQYFNVNDVVRGISEKIIRRHPHVFGSVTVRDSHEVTLNWEKIKAKEREGSTPAGLLDGVSRSLPALMRAVKLQKKAAGVGFDWPDYRGAMEKIREEMDELESAISSGDMAQIERELGDLIFSTVNLARLIGVDPEAALAGTSEKFVRRFGNVEKMARHNGRELAQCALSELDTWWEEAKKQE
ncbi:MAG: Nucleoside triphosphate pyrophosphohydrolase [Pelotomaculum sp. PtaU1.Bin035]|nr:MAG: Nucleoside triphosphate pyrophosphohydrolase [Pelotomaculum sp. PtaU1.Bin035]